jgi:hypothetical protein
MKSVSPLFYLLIVCLASGCASSNLTDVKKVQPDEAMAVAKFRIIYNGKDVTKGCSILFNAPKTGYTKYQYILDETGYVFARLRTGTNRISMVLHKYSQHSFGPQELTCDLRAGDTVNYIGDITMEWNGVGSVAGFTLIAVGGPLGSALGTQGKLVVGVESHDAEAQQAFNAKFRSNRTLAPALLIVNPKP